MTDLISILGNFFAKMKKCGKIPPIMRYIAKIALSILCVLAVMLTPAAADVNDRLTAAVENCVPDGVERLIAKGADVNVKLQYNATLLHLAADACDLPEIIKILINAGIDMGASDRNKETPLYWAIREGKTETALALIQAGADVNIKNNNGLTPLHIAAIRGQPEAAYALIQAGADVNIKNSYGLTPLHMAAIRRQPEAAYALIQAGADPIATDNNGATALDIAKLYKDESVSAILEKMMPENHRPSAELSTTTYLFETVDMEPLKLSAGADIGRQLRYAVEKCDFTEIKRLSSSVANFNVKFKDKTTPLHLAARTCDSSEIIKTLISTGVDINARDRDGGTPLYRAIFEHKTHSALALIQAGADVDVKEKDGWTALHLAVLPGYIEIVNALIESGADVNVKNNNGMAPLHAAAQEGQIKAAGALIGAGANLNTKDESGWTPLRKAISNGQTESAVALIQAGANLNTKDKDGWTPLHAAISQGKPDAASALIQAGSDVNAKNNNGVTPLHIGASMGQMKIAVALIQAGADVNAKDNVNKWTPLHAAAFDGHPDIAIILIEAGAYIPATDNSGWTSLEIAKHKKNWSVVAVLENPPRVKRRPQTTQPPRGESAPNVAIAPPPKTAGTAEFVFENAWRSIVFITDGEGQGSGVIIRPNIVATNCHVIEGGNINVYKATNRSRNDSEAFPATVRRWDEDNDFCLLDVPGLWGIPANVRKYDTLRIGENVYGIGAPQGFDLSISSGLISQLRVREGNRKMIQTDAAISPGSSGGGLFDREGNLIGIITSKRIKEGVEGIGFAIPADLALE